MNPLGDNGIFDDQPHHSNLHDFARTATATMIGAAVGASLDNTRFGRWFNTSRIIGLIFDVVKLGVLALVGLYIYFVIKVW